MVQIYNVYTNEVIYVGATLTDCKKWAIKNKIVKVEKSKYFRHLIWGHWDTKRVS
jgi:hypothetical protein